jgi:hypothetical protein
MEHEYVTNTLKGGDESHSVATLSRMFSALAQKVKDAECNEGEGVQQNSILDNIPLAQELRNCGIRECNKSDSRSYHLCDNCST